MKQNVLLIAMTAGLAFAAASCSKSDISGGRNGESSVTFAVETTDLMTKAYGDGEYADKLMWAVYDSEGNVVEALSATDLASAKGFENLTSSISLKLLNGFTYSILFWAANEDYADFYTIDWQNGTVTLNTEIAGNNEAADAFYHYLPAFTVNGNIAQEITLKRPFAQLNIGTYFLSDAAVSGFDMTADGAKTTIGIADMANILDVRTGLCSGNATVTFTSASLPDGETFPVKGCDYLSMCYLPASNTGITYDLTLTCTSGTGSISHAVTSVPFKMNYKTNIFGSLLTSDAEYQIMISTEMGSAGSQDPYCWDGTSVTPAEDIEYDEATSTYYVASGADLAGIAKIVNDGDKMTGKTVKLVRSIDLGDKQWTPIGKYNLGANFEGTFDGDGYGIYNLYSRADEVKANAYGTALFGKLHNATVKNLDLDGVLIERSESQQANNISGAVAGYVSGSTVIENVNVANAKVCGIGRLGIIAGAMQSGVKLTVKGCTITDAVVSGSYCCAPYVGHVSAGLTIELEDNTVINCTFEQFHKDTHSDVWVELTEQELEDYAVSGQTISGQKISGVYWDFGEGYHMAAWAGLYCVYMGNVNFKGDDVNYTDSYCVNSISE